MAKKDPLGRSEKAVSVSVKPFSNTKIFVFLTELTFALIVERQWRVEVLVP